LKSLKPLAWAFFFFLEQQQQQQTHNKNESKIRPTTPAEATSVHLPITSHCFHLQSEHEEEAPYHVPAMQEFELLHQTQLLSPTQELHPINFSHSVAFAVPIIPVVNISPVDVVVVPLTAPPPVVVVVPWSCSNEKWQSTNKVIAIPKIVLIILTKLRKLNEVQVHNGREEAQKDSLRLKMFDTLQIVF